MSQNNTHLGETKEQRLKRFTENPPSEVINTLTNSMANYFMNELHGVFQDPGNFQTTLMFLGTHSIALTIANGFFNKQSEQGYRLFLEHFIDGDSPETKFSTVASRIHEWRNVLAHRWINVAGHSFSYDFDMAEGWKIEDEFLFINPRIYLEQFVKAFGAGGRVYQFEKILIDDAMLEAAKNRFISKYTGDA